MERGEFFFQLLELGYEKFPHNTTDQNTTITSHMGGRMSLTHLMSHNYITDNKNFYGKVSSGNENYAF